MCGAIQLWAPACDRAVVPEIRTPRYACRQRGRGRTAGKRRKYCAEFKAKVALEAIPGEATIAELVIKYGMRQTAISTWKRQIIEGMAGTFSGNAEVQAAEK